MKFMSAYAAAPVCTPTRCAFVTGRYPQRLEVGLHEPLTGLDLDKGLPPDHPTVASLLKANGYDTALIGKWHLGWKPEFGPNRHGFDEFFGILSGAGDYFTHRSSDSKGPDLWENLTPVERVGYLTDLLSDRAAQFVTRISTPAVLSQPPLHRAALAVGRTGRRCHRSHDTRRWADDRWRIAEDLRRDDEEHGRRNRPRAATLCNARSSSAIRWSSSPATTAANAIRTTGRFPFRRCSLSRVASACRPSSAGPA